MNNVRADLFAFLSILSLILLFATVDSFPCPPECICKPREVTDDGLTRMNYMVNCANTRWKSNRLIYRAQPWSILEDKTDDDDTIADYIISVDLANSSSFKQFDNSTIQISGYSFSIQSLSLANQPAGFQLASNAFNSFLFENLQVLNLSSCCSTVPTQCTQLFRPLNKLGVLDLSGSDMYKSCLDTPDTIASSLRNLILRNNEYDTNTFSHTSPFFTGVRTINGKLDLGNSRFNLGTQLKGNCVFDIFTHITILDFSAIQFLSISNNTEVHLKHLLQCKANAENDYNGRQLTELYLRQLKLQYLPEWFTDARFPQLARLDLSNNQISSIDVGLLAKLSYVSLAYNPIEFEQIHWQSNLTYEFINLRSTKTTPNRTFSLSTQLESLFRLSTNVDYSENSGNIPSNLTKFLVEIDFSPEVALKLSRMNIYSFDIQEISRFDDLSRLDVSFNHLTELNLAKQSKLAYLDCSHQRLQMLILSSENSNLIELQCSNNSLTSTESVLFDKYENIRLIDLSSNQIKNLSCRFNSRYLHTVNFRSNRIERVPSKIFHDKLLSLYSLDLSWNKIDVIDAYAFQSPNVQILDLTGNPLKTIAANFLFTSSLRLFYIVNTTQELITRCARTTSNDHLLSTYLAWLQENGTYMQNSQPVPINRCLRPYRSRSKTKWMKFNDAYHVKHLSLYVVMAAITTGILLGALYLYRKNRLNFFTHFKHYRLLDRQHSREILNDVDGHPREDDEIAMHLDESPFNTCNRIAN